jgi:hypothetical protein
MAIKIERTGRCLSKRREDGKRDKSFEGRGSRVEYSTFNLFEFSHQLVGNTSSSPSFFRLSLHSISFLMFRFAFLSIADLHLYQDTTSKETSH